MNKNLENTQAQMKKGTVELAVLLLIGNGDSYAGDIIKGLKSADLIVVEGTLYPLLSRLRREGLLDYAWQESPSGPPRKYYSLTDSGKIFVLSLLTTWNSLSSTLSTLITRYEKNT